ncbi:putative membrane protein [Collimonas arenae]|uniref:Putative membrane protein n=1 Tax=Collimonas arenae TaxID=279058 RepID=A0A127QGY2_9BURK|nr:putative membrane protein [Collimonas arenae]
MVLMLLVLMLLLNWLLTLPLLLTFRMLTLPNESGDSRE